MRQVFSSPRLENVEAVAQMLRDAGIEVRITDGRSYKGSMRSRYSYSDQDVPKPAVWVVSPNDQLQAREILRDQGLLESTRPTDSFVPLSFRNEEARYTKTPAQKRMFRIKVGLLLAMAVISVLTMLRGCHSTRPAADAKPATAQRVGGTPDSLAMVVFANELTTKAMVLCLSVDGVDADASVIAAIQRPATTVVPASECVRDFNPDKGSYQAKTGKPALIASVYGFKATGKDSGTVEFESFHHGEFAHYKTLEVRRVDGAWQVTKVLRHVASFGMSG
ncbi:hypothetical protein [Lysobacter fragariae]